MQVVKTIQEMRELSRRVKSDGKSIGFVPTMGWLHEGHMSLVKSSVGENEFTVMSIFVNPLQFGEGEDYEEYPRDLDRDVKIAEAEGVDAVFAPELQEMYPEEYSTHVEVKGLSEVMCGVSRPQFFGGIATVVTKLFNIVAPDRAYFGQKDAQQALIIRRMTKDLNFPIEIRVGPIIREKDGLAMASRNVYLSEEERKAALVIPESLKLAKEVLDEGERSGEKITADMKKLIESEPAVQIDYVTMRDIDTLKEVDFVNGPVLVAVGAWINGTRLIDNIMWGDE